MFESTISENQQIHLERVISKYYVASLQDIDNILVEFLTQLNSLNYTQSGQLFYSINSDLRADGTIIIECFLPVDEENQGNLPEEFLYHSYFQVLNLVATRVTGVTEREINTGVGNLAKYIRKNRFKEVTPAFYQLTVNDETVYTDIMVGVR
ncbi:DUF5085 family protein [Streptococcus loxodontisalivarius]|uniref:D-hexose-6-phosphate mutarotase n=1 Tax=Streptococcus loxodontisalivarius TaxID=1349415 RepID=A0ABS2PT77_9STRE|nr:DUF5085 family protein [Streptococcus loxodontisalivarius]MBM7642765.1 D-hexose-6-phosphate mutarotase [Streptococcus loxodontisalivarius]